MLVFVWLLVVLDDPEQNFPAMDADADGASGATVIARMLITQFAWILDSLKRHGKVLDA